MALANRVPQGGEQWGPHNEQYRAAIERYAAYYNVPVQLLLNLGRQESDWNPSTVSTAGAQGLMQFMPRTTASLRQSWNWPDFNPANNTDHAIEGAARYLRQIYNQFYGSSPDGNWGPVAAGYNWGHNGWRGQTLINWNDQTLAGLPAETQNYVLNTTRGLSSTLGIGSDANIPLGDVSIPLGNFQFIGDHWVPGGDTGQYFNPGNIFTPTELDLLPPAPIDAQDFTAPLPFAQENAAPSLQDWIAAPGAWGSGAYGPGYGAALQQTGQGQGYTWNEQTGNWGTFGQPAPMGGSWSDFTAGGYGQPAPQPVADSGMPDWYQQYTGGRGGFTGGTFAGFPSSGQLGGWFPEAAPATPAGNWWDALSPAYTDPNVGTFGAPSAGVMTDMMGNMTGGQPVPDWYTQYTGGRGMTGIGIAGMGNQGFGNIADMSTYNHTPFDYTQYYGALGGQPVSVAAPAPIDYSNYFASAGMPLGGFGYPSLSPPGTYSGPNYPGSANLPPPGTYTFDPSAEGAGLGYQGSYGLTTPGDPSLANAIGASQLQAYYANMNAAGSYSPLAASGGPVIYGSPGLGAGGYYPATNFDIPLAASGFSPATNSGNQYAVSGGFVY